MSDTKTFDVTCIVCPVGCRATVTVTGSDVKVEGVDCPRGRDYAIKEVTNPVRDFFTILHVKGGQVPVCPVRSTQPVPKDKVLDCAKGLRGVVLEAPIHVGDVIEKDICGLGIDIVATRDVGKANEMS